MLPHSNFAPTMTYLRMSPVMTYTNEINICEIMDFEWNYRRDLIV